MKTLLSTAIVAALLSGNAIAAPTIVTQDNFPQAYTNMRLGAMIQKTGGVNTFFDMPVPSSNPKEQFVVRMNRDTPYSVSVIDMSSANVYVTVPKTDRYVTIQIVDENITHSQCIFQFLRLVSLQSFRSYSWGNVRQHIFHNQHIFPSL